MVSILPEKITELVRDGKKNDALLAFSVLYEALRCLSKSEELKDPKLKSSLKALMKNRDDDLRLEACSCLTFLPLTPGDLESYGSLMRSANAQTRAHATVLLTKAIKREDLVTEASLAPLIDRLDDDERPLGHSSTSNEVAIDALHNLLSKYRAITRPLL